ncbi:Uma2 family endonuclease [Jiangella ureilytica]|uniref:Uma2 family endonuclease n=1 Tax=Jiangella ureilytica TaxID=2530374 RepID=A0A4R4RB04_9ACTN|nr:Uma2 family endonuclease [Jiangella ureilytica]TDC46331.1 Uma2 family endonuclease [Jiangella ureilytica]
MVAETLPAPVAEPVPSWVYPPGGFTAEKFLKLEGLPKHTQLIDGSLVFVSPQQLWHSKVIELLVHELDRQAPDGLRAIREMSVRLGDRQVPEPDVAVITAEAYNRSDKATHFFGDDVVLAIEVVSPDSIERDRDTKPHKYALAGIEHFWRIEEDGGRPVVYTYVLNAIQEYTGTGIHHDRLSSKAPYPIDIDLTKVHARPS